MLMQELVLVKKLIAFVVVWHKVFLQILMNVLPTMETVDRFASILLEATSVLVIVVLN